MLKKARLLKLGLQTLLGIRKQGYFIPYRYAHQTPHAKAEICYATIQKKMQQAKPQFNKTIKQAAQHLPRLKNINENETTRFSQSWFPRLDAVIAYNMVATHKPKNIVEIGCGHSTRFMNLAINDNKLKTKFTAIDPAPRAKLPKNITHKKTYIQNVKISTFKKLKKNDLLFIDSSHILQPGTDVDLILNGIIPILEKGVKIHIHDIFLPHDYPKHWKWRGYNEQIAVATLLQNPKWKILWASNYIIENHKNALQKSGLLDLPLMQGAIETSLWLERI